MMVLLISFIAFCTTVAVGFLAGVEPVTILIRGTIALGIFSMLGLVFSQIIARSIMHELNRLKHARTHIRNENDVLADNKSVEAQ